MNTPDNETEENEPTQTEQRVSDCGATSCYVYEIVDCSNDEMYFPMGIYLDEQEAIKELEHAEYHHAHYPEEYVRMEVRKRKVGYSGDNHKMVFAAEWVEKENEKTGDWEMTRVNLT